MRTLNDFVPPRSKFLYRPRSIVCSPSPKNVLRPTTESSESPATYGRKALIGNCSRDVAGSLILRPRMDGSSRTGRASANPSKSRSRAGLRHRERRARREPDDARRLPAAEHVAENVAPILHEREDVGAVEREPVRRMEPRVAFRIRRVRPLLVGVARADERGLGRGVERTASRVARRDLQTVAQPLDPFDLNSVVPGLGVIAHDEVRRVARIRPPFVGAGHAQADLVVRDRHHDRAGRVRAEPGQARAGTIDVRGDAIDRLATQIREARGGRVVRMIRDDHRSVERRQRQVAQRVLQVVGNVVAVVVDPQRSNRMAACARRSGSTAASPASPVPARRS